MLVAGRAATRIAHSVTMAASRLGQGERAFIRSGLSGRFLRSNRSEPTGLLHLTGLKVGRVAFRLCVFLPALRCQWPMDTEAQTHYCPRVAVRTSTRIACRSSGGKLDHAEAITSNSGSFGRGPVFGPVASKTCVFPVVFALPWRLEIRCRLAGCGFESHALRSYKS